MIENDILFQMSFILLHYFIGVVFFWHVKHSMYKLTKTINEAIKSPRNRSKIESHLKKIQKSKKLSLMWPLVILSDLKDEIKK